MVGWHHRFNGHGYGFTLAVGDGQGGLACCSYGVYSRVTAGMSIRNSSLFIEVRDLSRYEGQLRNVN